MKSQRDIPVKKPSQSTGQLGETIAAAYLVEQGYEILVTNWHCPQGEIDIVAQSRDWLVFVEVKTRRGQASDAAFAAVTPRKRERLIATAYAYLQAHHREDTNWRIDVIAVTLQSGSQPGIDHAEDALDW